MEGRRIALIGFRATGKSIIGRILSEKLGWKYVDMDEELIASFGEDISSWVRAHGWESFREAEADLLDKLSREADMIVSTGGGVVLKERNRENLKEHFLVIWLQASPETIRKRIRQDSKSESYRPSLTELPLEEEIGKILLERVPLYGGIADLRLLTEGFSASELVEQICHQLSLH